MPVGIDIQIMDTDNKAMPNVLRELLVDIEHIGNGNEVVPANSRVSFVLSTDPANP